MIFTDRFVYVHEPKTGGTFVTSMLFRLYGLRWTRWTRSAARALQWDLYRISSSSLGDSESHFIEKIDNVRVVVFNYPYLSGKFWILVEQRLQAV